jgi:hypothetical protein
MSSSTKGQDENKVQSTRARHVLLKQGGNQLRVGLIKPQLFDPKQIAIIFGNIRCRKKKKSFSAKKFRNSSHLS